MPTQFLVFNSSKRFFFVDLLRSLSIISVFLFHYNEALFPNGWIGVDIFFVISGYLITLSLAKKISHITSIMSAFKFFREFISSRFIRIYTPFLMFIPLTLFIGEYTLDYSARTNNNYFLMISSLFLSSPYMLFSNKGYFQADSIDLSLHMWSISAEMISYILFSLTLLAVSTLLNRFNLRQTYLFLIGSLIFLLIGIISFFSLGQSYYNIGGMLILFGSGALAAYIVHLSHFNSFFSEDNSNSSFLVPCALSFSFLVISLSPLPIPNYPNLTFLIPFILTSFPLILYSSRNLLSFNSVSNRPLLLNVLLFPGIYSLSFYLFHIPSIFVSKYIQVVYQLSGLQCFGLSVLITFFLSVLSSYFFEFKLSTQILLHKCYSRVLLAAFGLIPMALFWSFNLNSTKWVKAIGTNQYSYSLDCNRDYFYSYNSSSIVDYDSHQECLFSNSVPGTQRLHVLGDSHADVLYNSLTKPSLGSYARYPLDRCSFFNLNTNLRCRALFINSLSFIDEKFGQDANLIFSFWIDSVPKNFNRSNLSSLLMFITSELENLDLPGDQISFIFSKPQSNDFFNDFMCMANEIAFNSKRCQNGYSVSKSSIDTRNFIINHLQSAGFIAFDASNMFCSSASNAALICSHLFTFDDGGYNINVDNHHLSSRAADLIIKSLYISR